MAASPANVYTSAVWSDGAATSNPATVSITVVASSCLPRPRVASTAAADGSRLNVHVEATPRNGPSNNPLLELRFGDLHNAVVTLNNQPISDGQVVMLAPNTFAVDFTVKREKAGEPTTVPVTIVDGCGEWPTFVGGGTGAAF